MDFIITQAAVATEVTITPFSQQAKAFTNKRIGQFVSSWTMPVARLGEFQAAAADDGLNTRDDRVQNQTWSRVPGIGDRVRSYDFEGRKDCYVEGTIVRFEEVEGCRRYAIRVEDEICLGLMHATGRRFVYPPVNGTPKALGGVCNGVEVI